MAVKGFFYRTGKKEIMGTDSLFVCDGRYNQWSMIEEAKRQAHMNRNVADQRYVRLFNGTIRNPVFYTDYIPVR
jgi:glutamine amidotransferase-like uncharacterized protein